MEPQAGVLMSVVLECLANDNEENALVCLRILFEVLKNIKSSVMESCASKFVELAKSFFAGFGDVVAKSFPATLAPVMKTASEPVDEVAGARFGLVWQTGVRRAVCGVRRVGSGVFFF